MGVLANNTLDMKPGKPFIARMDNAEQVQKFCNDLDNLVEHYSQEFDLTYASIVGALQMKIHLLCSESQEDDADPPIHAKD